MKRNNEPVNPAAQPEDHKEARRGSVMVLVIFVLVLLGGMGVALMLLTQNELKMSQANLRVKRSFYLAEAGLEDGRRTLYDVNGGGGFSDDLAIAAGGNTTVDFDVAALAPTYDGAGRVTGFSGFGDDVPVRPQTVFGSSQVGGGWYAAFLTNDPQEGLLNTTDANDRVMLTSIGAGRDKSLEIVQAIIEPRTLLPPIPPATITLLGPTPDFFSGNSNAEAYSGEDCHFSGGGVPGLFVPIVGVVGDPAETSAETGLDSNPDFQSGGYAGTGAVVDLTDPTDPLLVDSGQGPMDPSWSDCAYLHDLVETLRVQATYTCDLEGTGCTLPATTVASISFLTGEAVELGPGYIGTGLLVVTGALNYRGNADFAGLMLVIGRGDMLRDGGGNGYISGGTIVADIAGPDDVYGTADDCTGGPDGDGFGISEYEVNGGGNTDIDYCSTLLNQINSVRNYKIVEFLQR